MTGEEEEVPDPLIDEIRETRRRLVEQYGGLRGWAEHLRELDRKDPPKAPSRRKETQQA